MNSHTSVPLHGFFITPLTSLRGALMMNRLNGGQLDGATISVSIPGSQDASQNTTTSSHLVHPPDASSVAQEDKPRTAIIAEYLAHGYQLSDDIAKRAIDLDQKHGWSAQWKTYLQHIDQRVGERYQQSRAAHSTPTGAAQEGLSEKQTELDAGKLAAVPSTDEKSESATAEQQGQPPSFVAQVQQQAKTLLSDANSPVAQAQSSATRLLAQHPEVKARGEWAWSKLGEYYNKAANHPAIRGFCDNAAKSVQDVHEEAKRIQQQRAAGGPGGAAGTSAPPGLGLPGTANIGRSSASWLLLFVLLFSSFSIQSALAHGHGADGYVPPAEIAGAAPHKKGEESYVQRHMASEHHIGAFDLGSFFGIHDLNRDGVLDRAEIEAIYGVHHSRSVKHSPSAEVHDEKADTIVAKVLARLDTNKDGLVTKREFINGGPDGLPSFEEYGKNALGHHYDEESEYFVHHEEVYHNTPEAQRDEAYTHKEDLEHFAHHEAIEHDEENRERHAEGMPSIEEDERLRKEAAARGHKYTSPWDEAQHRKAYEQRVFREMVDGHDEHGYAQQEAESTHHTFRGPGGSHVVNSKADAAAVEHEPDAPLPGETHEGFEHRKAMWAERKQAERFFEKLQKERLQEPAATALDPKGKLKKLDNETEDAYRKRLNKAKWDAFHNAGSKGTGKPADGAIRGSGPAKVRERHARV